MQGLPPMQPTNWRAYPSAILFYGSNRDYYEFSNFYLSPFELDGEVWQTVEHFFQAAKFADGGHAAAIRQAKTPTLAKKLGQSTQFPIRADWDEVRVSVMRRAVHAKFSQNPGLRGLLVQTGTAVLVEDARQDYVWGCGASGMGLNYLGRVLMEVRTELAART